MFYATMKPSYTRLTEKMPYFSKKEIELMYDLGFSDEVIEKVNSMEASKMMCLESVSALASDSMQAVKLTF